MTAQPARPWPQGNPPVNGFEAYRQNRQRYGNMVTPRQQEAALQRAQQEIEQAALQQVQQEQARQNAWQIDWNKVDAWVSPGPDGSILHNPHNMMEPKHLWETICWIVTNCIPLFQQYTRPTAASVNISLALAAKQWLRQQPAFRALIQEAIRRHMTFPKDVFRYLKEYVLGRDTDEIQVSAPWADPAAAHQINELAAFLNEPVNLPKQIDPLEEYGREFRTLDLD